jgi:transcriptional regulator with XRE-family HTH domain
MELVGAAQLRAARALLGISQGRVAELAGISVPTVKRCEADAVGSPKVSAETKLKIKAALEAAGVEFIPENGGGVGVRLKKRAG